MFYGQCTTYMKEQRIISLPDQFASDLHSDLFITQGFDRNLIIMPENGFLDFYQHIRAMNMANPLARLFLRHFLANATFISHKNIGHIEISDRLSEYADLSKEEAVVLVGQGNHLEVWQQKTWQEQSLEIQDSGKNAHRFAVLDIRVG